MEGNIINNIIYFAGIFDGEGCVMIVKTMRIKRKEISPDYYLKLSISNTNKNIMEWIKDNIGGNYILYISKRQKEKDVYKWFLSGERAYNLLIKIFPYSIIKNKQIKIGMEFFNEKCNCQGRKKISTEETLKREYYWKVMKELNKRGK